MMRRHRYELAGSHNCNNRHYYYQSFIINTIIVGNSGYRTKIRPIFVIKESPGVLSRQINCHKRNSILVETVELSFPIMPQ